MARRANPTAPAAINGRVISKAAIAILKPLPGDPRLIQKKLSNCVIVYI